jgi:chemotaxis protein methyltransferase WspC
MDHIVQLLNRVLGLDVASIGRPAVERAVIGRMAACALGDVCEYREFVRSSRAELQALIEAVVVPETWFFRDRAAFAVLARAAIEAGWSRHGRSARILSVPSSTGEEPYSIAMALLDAGLTSDAFHVEAVDVSEAAISRALAARYGRNSFRGRDLEYRARHFHAEDGGYRLAERVRRQVSFRQSNLFSLDATGESVVYDAIFCRNLLIYFDRATQDQAVRTLARRLAPNGLLFVAPSETAIVLNHAFVPVKVPMAFAFRKSDGSQRQQKPSPPVATPWASVPLRQATRIANLRRNSNEVTTAPVPAPAPDALLDEAAQLANGGHLVEATARCETYLKRFGPGARAFHLLGMVRDAAGAPEEAAGWYRKALYLDPNHQEALLHLALVVEQLGDLGEGRRLRARAARKASLQGAHDGRG